MAIVVLVSGRGSNLGALLEAGLPVSAVVSNRAAAGALALAAARGVPTRTLEHGAFDSREAFDVALAAAIDGFAPRLVVLAGFMRILGPAFVERYAGRLMNIHPSLLPAFPGLDTHARALGAGVKVHGCTVHFVTAQLDHGPIIAQALIPVLADDTAAALEARVLRQEHLLYPRAVRWFLEDRLQIDAARVTLRGDEGQLLCDADLR